MAHAEGDRKLEQESKNPSSFSPDPGSDPLARPSEDAGLRVRALELSPATIQALELLGQGLVEQIAGLSDAELLENPYLNPSGVAEIRNALQRAAQTFTLPDPHPEVRQQQPERLANPPASLPVWPTTDWNDILVKTPLHQEIQGSTHQSQGDLDQDKTSMPEEDLQPNRWTDTTKKWQDDIRPIERGKLVQEGSSDSLVAAQDLSFVPIESLGLSIRTYNALRRRGVKTLRQLAALSDEQIYQIRNVGRHAFEEIRQVLEQFPNALAPATDIGAHQVVGSPASKERASDTPIEVLDLPIRVFNTLARTGILYVEQILSLSDEELLHVRNLGGGSLALLRAALDRFVIEHPNADAGSARVSESSSHRPVVQGRNASLESTRIAVASSSSWLLLLENGHNWDEVQALDQALRARGLPPLRPLPADPLVSPEAVSFLLRFGCPLAKIPARRLTICRAYRAYLEQVGLDNVLRVFLASRTRLQEAPARDDFDSFAADVEYYAGWLNSQSEWSAEVRGVGTSPVAVFRLASENWYRQLDGFLAYLTQREREILIARYTLEEGSFRTLQEVADQYSVTRERVRQIVIKVLGKLRGQLRVHETLSTFVWLCERILEHTGLISGPTLLAELAGHLSPNSKPTLTQVILLLDGVAEAAHYIEGYDIFLSRALPRNAPESWVRIINHALRKAGAPMRFDDLVRAIAQGTGSEAASSAEVVARCLEAIPDFINVEDDYWGLVSWEGHITDDLVMILRRLGRPAHYGELAELLNERLPEGERKPERNILAHLQRLTDLFVRVGPGTFDLREKQPELPGQPIKYLDLMEQVLREAGEPLTLNQVFRRVNEMREAKRSTISMYLTMNSRFLSFGTDHYGLAMWANDTATQTKNQNPLPNSGSRDEFTDELAREVMQWLQKNAEQN